MRKLLAIKVIWADGEEEFLKEGGSHTPFAYSSRKKAEEQVEFMKIGMDKDEFQSINVVPYPMHGTVAQKANEGNHP